jgi:hypothetical protein
VPGAPEVVLRIEIVTVSGRRGLER